MTKVACVAVMLALATTSCGTQTSDTEESAIDESESALGTGFGLPFPAGAAYVVTQGPFNGFSHVAPYNQHAVDFGLPANSAVVASAAGRVAFEGWYQGEIKAIIDHGGNRCTLYTHLNQTIINAGDWVRRGQLIGYSGATGRVTAPHLHWDMINCNDWTSREIVPTDEMGTNYPVGAVARSTNTLR